jgi:hypothetical protein
MFRWNNTGSLARSLALFPLQWLELSQALTSLNQLVNSLERVRLVPAKLFTDIKYVDSLLGNAHRLCCLDRRFKER